jgi:hypothetical protein
MLTWKAWPATAVANTVFEPTATPVTAPPQILPLIVYGKTFVNAQGEVTAVYQYKFRTRRMNKIKQEKAARIKEEVSVF